MSYAGAVTFGHREELLPHEYVGVAPEFFTVLYRPGDYAGLALATLSLVPPMILVAHLAVFLCRRQAGDLWFAGGQVVGEVLNNVVKHAIKQARPAGPVVNMPTTSHGMPSAHTQFMAFCATYTILRLRGALMPAVERVAWSTGSVVLALLVGYSRYYLHYHSSSQVAWGFVGGSVLAICWYALGHMLRAHGVFQWGLELWPCRMLCVKDTEASVHEEYAQWQHAHKRAA